MRQTEPGSFEQFAAQELPALVRYAHMVTGDRELARDLVQDVMLKAYSQWDRISKTDRPTLYVKTMIARAFVSWRRRWAVRNVILADGKPDREARADHAADIVDRDDLWRRMAKLSPRQRAVLVLRYYEGLKDDEIATVLGCTTGTVRGYASRAIAALRLTVRAELCQPRE